LEFVKDATAVLFITALDDLSETVPIELTDYKEDIESSEEDEDVMKSGPDQETHPKQSNADTPLAAV